MTQIEQSNGTLVVRMDRDMVASNVEQIRAKLQGLIEQGQIHLVLDLAGVDMIDSKGLAIFMLCHKSLVAAGGRLVVVTANEDFRQLFHVMRMDEHFKVCESL